jgi:hypothetical protein
MKFSKIHQVEAELMHTDRHYEDNRRLQCVCERACRLLSETGCQWHSEERLWIF